MMLSDELCYYPIQFTLNIFSLVATIAYVQSLLSGCVTYRPGFSRSGGRFSYLIDSYKGYLVLISSGLCGYVVHTLKCLSQALLLRDTGGRLWEKITRTRRTLKWPQQHHQQRRAQGWFSEYVGNQRPLSTTWPWSIRPSLAVIWGVCWMFHGDKGGGSTRIPPNMLGDNALYDIDEVLEMSYHGENTAVRQPLRQAATSNAVRRSQSDSGLHVTVPGPSSRHPQSNMQELSGRERSRFRGSSIAHPYASDASHHTVLSSNYGPNVSLSHDNPALLPSHGTVLSTRANGIITEEDPPYNQFLHQMLLNTQGLNYDGRQNSQHLTQSPLESSEQLTNSTVPHLTFCASSTGNHSVSGTAPREITEGGYYPSPNTVATASYDNLNLPFGGFVIRGGSGSVDLPAAGAASNKTGLSPHPNPMMPLHTIIKMPNSEGEPSPSASSSYLRKASVSSSSAVVPAPSEEGLSPAAKTAEAPLTNRNRSIRRTESPPLNVNKKMTCKFAECAGITFDRKCEWSKHMDKHDRPYKCTAPGCEKLLGFTYSGGLLRHEREVHKMHGGTKAPLYCPVTGCKRHSGDGFTRRENLGEHIRRVHQRMSATPASAGVSSSGRGSGMVERDGRRSSSTTRLKREEEGVDTRSPSVGPATILTGERNAKIKKRRRGEADDGYLQGRRDDDYEDSEYRSEYGRPSAGLPTAGHNDHNDLRGEVKRLRRELSLRDTRLQELQATVDRLSGPEEEHRRQQRRQQQHQWSPRR